MRNYRLRPKLVQAVQFDPLSQPWPKGVLCFENHLRYYFHNPEAGGFGEGRVFPGDWIVTDDTGTHVSSKEAFDIMYEKIEGVSE